MVSIWAVLFLEQPVLRSGVKSYALPITRGGASALTGKWSRWRILAYTLVPTFAVLATWLSGFIETSLYDYGFPVPWKTMVFGRAVCPPSPLEIACFLGPRLAVYNWVPFVLDIAFYLTVGYATIFGSNAALGRLFRCKTLPLPNRRAEFEYV